MYPAIQAQKASENRLGEEKHEKRGVVMKISPVDIAHKTFNRKFTGFSAEEVGDFLSQVSQQMEELIRERNDLKEALRDRELNLLEFKEKDDLLKNTIKTATKMAEKLQFDAEREAKLILNDAHQKAEVIVRDSRESLRRVYQEVTELKKIRMQFENNLRALLESHLAMMEQGQKIMPNPQISGLNFEHERSTEESKVKSNVEKAIKSGLRTASHQKSREPSLKSS